MIILESEGLKIKMSNGTEYQVYFIPVLILGDNLGLNSLLGFSKSFNGCFCRFCKIDKSLSKTATSADPMLRRNYSNYKIDLIADDVKGTGIVEKCQFNRIPSFHVIDNLSVDAMHDVVEGICQYDMTNSILYFIQTKKFFSLEVLNKRKRTFEYGELEIGNNSPDISITHLKKKHLKMSASEILTFVIYFPLMVGDLVPQDDAVWQFVLLLR